MRYVNIFFSTMLLVWLAAWVIVSIVASVLPIAHPEVKTSFDLVSLSDRFSKEGSYFLFSGSSGEYQRFSYYRKDADGFVHWETVYASEVVIMETNSEPKIKTYRKVLNNKILRSLIPLINDYYTLIEVPKGSVLHDYQLDGK